MLSEPRELNVAHVKPKQHIDEVLAWENEILYHGSKLRNNEICTYFYEHKILFRLTAKQTVVNGANITLLKETWPLATCKSLTIGWVFLFTTGSLSFLHVGIVFSFSLRRACSSKIGLTKKKAIFFKPQSIILKHKFVERGRSIFCNSPSRFCYFRRCRFFLLFWLLHLFPLFPSFLPLW